MKRHPRPAQGATSVALTLALLLAAPAHGLDAPGQPATAEAPRGNASPDSPKTVWEQVKKDSRNAWDEASETSRDAWEKTRDGSVRLWDQATDEETWRKAKEGSESAWEATKSFTQESWEKTKSAVTGPASEPNAE